ncbi:MAG: HD domain-containing protein [Patescibacteria group bacterium]
MLPTKSFTVLKRAGEALLQRKEFFFCGTILEAFSGSELYLVGGTVRDLLLKRPMKDYDLVVRGVSLSKLQTLLKDLGTVNLVGKKFGVLKFTPRESNMIIDIALPRTEFSLTNTGQYRDFAIQSDYRMSIENDLARRDFTINALAYDLRAGKLLDPWGGMNDLSSRTIRAVGDPHTRFQEDYTRVLRAVRFSCQLGFVIAPHTLRAVKEYVGRLNDEIKGERVVPYELVSREMIKALVSDTVVAFDYFDTLGIFECFMPELTIMKRCPQPKQWHSEGDVWTHTRLALQSLSSKAFVKEFDSTPPSALLILAVLLHDIGKPLTIKTPKKDHVSRIRFDGHDRVGAVSARSICERLRTSSVEGYGVDPEHIHWLVKNHLLILNADLSTLKNTTIERYFFRDAILGSALLQLSYADGAGSITQRGVKGLDRYRTFKKRLVLFKKTAGMKRALPKSILDGDEIMKITKLNPGPDIGRLLTVLREEQLAGRIKTKGKAKKFITATQNSNVKTQ